LPSKQSSTGQVGDSNAGLLPFCFNAFEKGGKSPMARETVTRVVSDLSGEEIAEDQAWIMELTPPDGRRNKVRLDLSGAEARDFVSKGTEIKRRGRRPGTKNK
jgi:hypothetical protein